MILRPRKLFETITELGHDMDFEPLLIPKPTAAAPGSEEKIHVLQARLEAGEDLYHFGDARIAASPESQAQMANFVRAHSKQQREANRANPKRKSAQSWANANAAKKRMKEAIKS